MGEVRAQAGAVNGGGGLSSVAAPDDLAAAPRQIAIVLRKASFTITKLVEQATPRTGRRHAQRRDSGSAPALAK